MPPLLATVADDDPLRHRLLFRSRARRARRDAARSRAVCQTRSGALHMAQRGCGTDQAELTIDIQMRGLGRDLMDYIAACLRQIAYVEVVLTSEKLGASG